MVSKLLLYNSDHSPTVKVRALFCREMGLWFRNCYCTVYNSDHSYSQTVKFDRCTVERTGYDFEFVHMFKEKNCFYFSI